MRGAAYATVIAQYVGLAAYFAMLFGRRKVHTRLCVCVGGGGQGIAGSVRYLSVCTHMEQSPLNPPPAASAVSVSTTTAASISSRLRRDEEAERAQRQQRRAAAAGSGRRGVGADGGGFRRTCARVWRSLVVGLLCCDHPIPHDDPPSTLKGWSRRPATRSRRSPSSSPPTPPCSCGTVRVCGRWDWFLNDPPVRGRSHKPIPHPNARHPDAGVGALHGHRHAHVHHRRGRPPGERAQAVGATNHQSIHANPSMDLTPM